jgi:hypothetical protein
MPFMQPQIQRIDLAKSKKEHKENEPGQYRSKGEKIPIADSSDEHRKP